LSRNAAFSGNWRRISGWARREVPMTMIEVSTLDERAAAALSPGRSGGAAQAQEPAENSDQRASWRGLRGLTGAAAR
jgi:hypothetical protein